MKTLDQLIASLPPPKIPLNLTRRPGEIERCSIHHLGGLLPQRIVHGFGVPK